MGIILILVFLAGIVAALERHHRRTEATPHAAPGADGGFYQLRDLDLDHVRHDLAARA
jgi:hypothetical protein